MDSTEVTNRFDLRKNKFEIRIARTDDVLKLFNVVGATGSTVEAQLMGTWPEYW